MLESKVVTEDKNMEEEYVPGSRICALFAKDEVKLITFLNYKRDSG